MNRAPALRKLLAVEPLYRDEIFEVMGGHRLHVMQAINELARCGDLRRPTGPHEFRSRYRLTEPARARAFGGARD